MERIHADKPGARPVAEVAPEPDDIMWMNLSINDAERSRQVAKVVVATIVILTIGTFINTAVAWATAQLKYVDPTDGLGTAEEQSRYERAYAYSVAAFSTGSTAIPIVVNMVIRLVVSKMIRTEVATAQRLQGPDLPRSL